MLKNMIINVEEHYYLCGKTWVFMWKNMIINVVIICINLIPMQFFSDQMM